MAKSHKFKDEDSKKLYDFMKKESSDNKAMLTLLKKQFEKFMKGFNNRNSKK